MATIDFSTEPVANPASPPTGWSQPAWSDNARVDGTPSFSWFLSSGSESQWFFDTVQPTGAYSETTFYAVNSTSRGPILADASGNGYGLLCNSTNIRVFLYTSGSLVSLIHTSVGSAVATDTFRLQYNGSGDFSVLKNDVEISTFNDVTHTGPFYGGLFSRDGGAGISDVTVDAVAAQSITQADVTPEDGVTQTVTSSGLTVAYTAMTLGGYNILPLLDSTDPETASTYTLDIYAFDNPTLLPRLLDNVTLSATATGGTATQTVNIQPQAGTNAVKLTSVTPSTFVTRIAEKGITLAIGDIINWDTTGTAVIDAAANYTSNLTAGQFTRFSVQQGGDADNPATTTSFEYYPFGEGDTGAKRKKRRRTMIRNFTYYKDRWEKFGD
jgi:hypothetical protein